MVCYFHSLLSCLEMSSVYVNKEIDQYVLLDTLCRYLLCLPVWFLLMFIFLLDCFLVIGVADWYCCFPQSQ